MSGVSGHLSAWFENNSWARRLTNLKQTYDENRFPYLLVLPLFVFMAALVWAQFAYGLYMSFFQHGYTIETTKFIGLENYRFLLGWSVFHTAVVATMIYGVATTVIHMVTALLVALAVNQIRRANIFRSIALLPYTMPPVAVGVLWYYLLDPNFGPVFSFLSKYGILNPIYWANDPTGAMAVITLVAGWTFWPFAFLIIDASLTKIPAAQYESARMYGANVLQRFRHVTFPHIKSALLVAGSIRVIWNLVKVGQPLALTEGGPGFATSILGILLYNKTLSQGRYGQAYAIGMFLLLLTVGFTYLLVREFYREKAGGQ